MPLFFKGNAEEHCKSHIFSWVWPLSFKLFDIGVIKNSCVFPIIIFWWFGLHPYFVLFLSITFAMGFSVFWCSSLLLFTFPFNQSWEKVQTKFNENFDNKCGNFGAKLCAFMIYNLTGCGQPICKLEFNSEGLVLHFHKFSLIIMI